MLSEILRKVTRAERRLAGLCKELQDLESTKRGHLQELMRGGQRSTEIKKTDQAILRKGHAISRAKEQVGNLRAELERELARFRKDLIEEKQREVDQFAKQRTRYLKRIEELEVEISKYRYLITGKKDQHLVKVESLLPPQTVKQEHFVPLDEVIGRINLEISRINRMTSEALLGEYEAREKKGNQNP